MGRTVRAARPARSSQIGGIPRSARVERRPRARPRSRPGRDRCRVRRPRRYGDPDVRLREAEPVPAQVPGELDRFALEVVAEGEVAEHLEEREMPSGHPDDLDVRCAKTLLTRRDARMRRPFGAEKVGLQRMHPATVNSAEGPVALDHEADGSRRWSRCSKNSVKVRRISSEVISRISVGAPIHGRSTAAR